MRRYGLACFAAGILIGVTQAFAKTPGSSGTNNPPARQERGDASIVTTGTVVHVEVEGGFYGIKSDEGKNYDPGSLPDKFQKDGLRVRIEANKLEGVATIRMWGTVIKINKIEAVK